MGRIVALDIGRKRTGIAATDPLQLIANGVATVPTHQVPEYLVEYTRHETVELLVIGQPVDMHNEPSEATRFIEPIVNRIVKLLPKLQIVRHDERFTSRLAHRAMLEGGLGRMQRRDKALVDKISATIILQSYMQSQEWRDKQ